MADRRLCPACQVPINEPRALACAHCGALFSEVEGRQLREIQEARAGLITEARRALRGTIVGWVLGLGGLLSLLFGWSVVQAVKRVEDFVAAEVATRFADPEIEDTFQRAARDEGRLLIQEQILPEVVRFRAQIERQMFSVDEDLGSELAAFNDFLTRMKQDTEVSVDGMRKELAFLKQHNDIARLGHKAVEAGSRGSLMLLAGVAAISSDPEIRQAASAEMFRVKVAYIGTTRIKGFTLAWTDGEGKELTGSDIPTSALIGILGDRENRSWKERTSAAEVLGSRRKKGVPNVVLLALCDDPHLEVARQAKESFERLTAFQNPDVFGCEEARKWWQDHREEMNTERFSEEPE